MEELVYLITHHPLYPLATSLLSFLVSIVAYFIGRWITLRDQRRSRHIANMERLGAFIALYYTDAQQQARDLASIQSMLYVQYRFSLKQQDFLSCNTPNDIKTFFSDLALHKLTYKDLVL